MSDSIYHTEKAQVSALHRKARNLGKLGSWVSSGTVCAVGKNKNVCCRSRHMLSQVSLKKLHTICKSA